VGFLGQAISRITFNSFTTNSNLIYVEFKAVSSIVQQYNLALSAIAWGHALIGFSSQPRDSSVLETAKGLKSQLAKPKAPKEPFLVQHMHAFMDVMIPYSLTDVRDTCMLVITFFGFLWFNELAQLKVNYVLFFPSHMELTIEKAKNDQLWEGNVV
jgi:hypothetical protein